MIAIVKVFFFLSSLLLTFAEIDEFQLEHFDHENNYYEVIPSSDLNHSLNGTGQLYYNDWDDYDFAEHDQNVIGPMDEALVAIYVLITIVGLVANGVVFFVVFGRNEISRTVTAIYVVQLALADSLFLFSLPMFGMQKLTQNWSFGQGMCTLCQTIKFFNYYAGIFLLTAMSVDRYIAVTYGAKAYQLRTKKRTLLASAIIWMASIVMSIPIATFAKLEKFNDRGFCKLHFPGYHSDTSNGSVIILYLDSEYVINQEEAFLNNSDHAHASNDGPETNINDNDYPSSKYTCSHKEDWQGQAYNNWVIINFFIGFLLPFLVISLSYILIVKKLRSTEQRVANMTGKKTLAIRRKVTRMVAALVFAFIICWLPHHIFMLAKIPGFSTSVTTCVGIQQFLVALGFSNSAINPLLYTFLGHNFKERFRESVDQTRRKWRKSSMPTATGHITKSHSDHKNNSLSKMFGKIVTFRQPRISSVSSHNDEKKEVSQLKQDSMMKYQMPLLESNKKRTFISFSSDQNDHIDCPTSKCLSNQTELSRFGVDSKR